MPALGTVDMIYTIRDLKQLSILDLSCNYLHLDVHNYNNGHLNELGYNRSSSIQKLYLSNNRIKLIPRIAYTSKCLTDVDLSNNGITEWPFVFTEEMNLLHETSSRIIVNLSYNNISHI